MKQQTFKEHFAIYQQLLHKGDFLELIERLYDDEMIQIENHAAPVSGKSQLVELEKRNLSGVWEVSVRMVSLVLDEAAEKAMGEMEIKFHSKENGWMYLQEAFIQHWKNGKIVYQRFYYDAPERMENK